MVRADYSIEDNRVRVSNKVIGLPWDELGILLIRVLAYMQVGDHKTRQEFWEYIEKIIAEKKPRQDAVRQVLTDHKNGQKLTAVETVLDKVNKE